jgi:DNA-binding Lrp family transcriptional regulator
MARQDTGGARWTFLTNHGHVLLCLAQSPELRLRDVAEQVGVTERAVQRIVSDLVEEGYLIRRRAGRQNEYEIDMTLPLRHPVEAHQTVRTLMALIESERPRRAATRRTAGPSRTSRTR